MSVYIYHKLQEQLYFAYTWLRAFFMSELQLLKVEFPAPEGSPHPTNGIKSYTNISWKSPTKNTVAWATFINFFQQ